MHVYILGAGASAPDGVPTTAQLFHEAFFNFGGQVDGQPNTHVMGPWGKEDVLSLKPVLHVFDSFYGTHFEQHFVRLYKTTTRPIHLGVDTSQVEGFFTRLHRMYRGVETYGLALSKSEIEELYRQANYLFFHTLGYAGIGSHYPHYWAFVDKVLRQVGNHCIISFNYDLLLDNWLLKLVQRLDRKRGTWVPLAELMWTYGISFGSIYHKQYYDLPEQAKITYYKLHGSLNMGFNPKTGAVSLYTLCADHHAYARFHKGEWPDKPLLIPPLLQKEIAIPALEKIWRKASQTLALAEEIHVIGYSAPSADEAALQLFKSVEVERLKRVVIANPSVFHVRRIQGLLGAPDRLTTVYGSFEDYLKKEYQADLSPEKARLAAEMI